jgi:hypothetical protein
MSMRQVRLLEDIVADQKRLIASVEKLIGVLESSPIKPLEFVIAAPPPPPKKRIVRTESEKSLIIADACRLVMAHGWSGLRIARELKVDRHVFCDSPLFDMAQTRAHQIHCKPDPDAVRAMKSLHE